MAPLVSAALAVLSACCFGAAIASSGGLRGGTSDLPAAREVDQRAARQVPEVDDVDKASELADTTVGEVAVTEDPCDGEVFAAADVDAGVALVYNESTDDMDLFVNDSFGELTASAQWHHHSHGGNIMTLYHTTSPSAADSILRSGFHRGSSGWCGGAIYFVATPYLPRSKYGPETKSGAVIQVTVNMGRMAYMDNRCHSGFGTGMGAASRAGYDSITFNPGDGNEYIIPSASRIVSMRRYQ